MRPVPGSLDKCPNETYANRSECDGQTKKGVKDVGSARRPDRKLKVDLGKPRVQCQSQWAGSGNAGRSGGAYDPAKAPSGPKGYFYVRTRNLVKSCNRNVITAISSANIVNTA